MAAGVVAGVAAAAAAPTAANGLVKAAVEVEVEVEGVAEAAAAAVEVVARVPKGLGVAAGVVAVVAAAAAPTAANGLVKAAVEVEVDVDGKSRFTIAGACEVSLSRLRRVAFLGLRLVVTLASLARLGDDAATDANAADIAEMGTSPGAVGSGKVAHVDAFIAATSLLSLTSAVSGFTEGVLLPPLPRSTQLLPPCSSPPPRGPFARVCHSARRSTYPAAAASISDFV